MVEIKNQKDKIIVSLTSYPARINYVHLTIESLLAQTLKADVVILWLTQEEFPDKEDDLPQNLLSLCNKGLTIAWCDNIRSFKKLIPTYNLYHDSIIVTCDDDIIYDENMLEKLYKSFLKNPDCIHCHVITRLYFDSDNKLISLPAHLLYKYGWGKDYGKELKPASAFNKLLGGGGTLYPPNSLHKDIFDIETLKKYCPNNDDIWFHFQALRAGYKVKVVEDHNAHLAIIPGSQETALWLNINSQNNQFKKELNATFNLYPELKEMFDADNKANSVIIKNIYRSEKIKRFISNTFSIRNEYSNNIKHKVVTLVGIKMKFKQSAETGMTVRERERE